MKADKDLRQSNKAFLREIMLAVRNALTPDYRLQAEARITEEFLRRFAGFKAYALYKPIGSEVSTAAIDKALREEGKLILYPKTAGNTLLWGTRDFARGAFGVSEPRDTVEFTAEIAVIPAVAIDRRLYRIGYGKGCYDKFLASRKELLTVALVFEAQIIEKIHRAPHDIPVKAAVCGFGGI